MPYRKPPLNLFFASSIVLVWLWWFTLRIATSVRIGMGMLCLVARLDSATLQLYVYPPRLAGSGGWWLKSEIMTVNTRFGRWGHLAFEEVPWMGSGYNGIMPIWLPWLVLNGCAWWFFWFRRRMESTQEARLAEIQRSGRTDSDPHPLRDDGA